MKMGWLMESLKSCQNEDTPVERKETILPFPVHQAALDELCAAGAVIYRKG